MSSPTDVPNGHLANGVGGHEDDALDPTIVAMAGEKYAQERKKRLRAEGIGQFIQLQERSKELAADIWADPKATYMPGDGVKDGASCSVLIVGAGFGGMVAAVRLIQAGVPAESLHIVDSASGFGGTWFWNRYPGLMCDVESYIYVPLLEEMGYMPKHKYSYGGELREYAEKVADRWNLHDRAIFQARVTDLAWDDSVKRWIVNMERKNAKLHVKANFVVTSLGVLSTPHLPRFEGVEDFKGKAFHTSRWNYSVTGGSPTDTSLTKLSDKRVGIIGTGATAVQCIPHLAHWAQELYVFQRTPSAVDRRDQRLTDPEWWANEVTRKERWQSIRQENFNRFVGDGAQDVDEDLVNDGWTNMRSFSVLTGGPRKFERPAEEVNEEMEKVDLERQNRIRRRIDEIVKDKDTSEKLKPWYHGWCKRPCFHDDYLPAFNKPNVRLVDTDGQGIDRVTENGVRVDGKEYDLDVIIYATGFVTPFQSPFERSGFTVTGRTGQSIDDSYVERGVHTLHAVLSRDFPNLFMVQPRQCGATANYMDVIDQLSRHIAHIIAEVAQRARRKDDSGGEGNWAPAVTIEPAEEAEQEWGDQIASMAKIFAPLMACTPGYLNVEGARPKDDEEMMKGARGAIYAKGIANFGKILESWRAEGSMAGLEVTV